MARRSTPSPKQTAQLTVEQMKTGIARIQRRIHDLEAFDPTQLQERWAPEVKALERSIEETLELVFGRETTDYDRYMAAASLDSGPIIMGGGRNPIHEVHSFYEEGKRDALALLRQAARGLEERIADFLPRSPANASALETKGRSNRIFVVHGHDGEAREAIARFLERLGFDPIILHEQPNQGATVIEKFEKHSEGADFAVILLTGDDVGGISRDNLAPRARQNVILELGYFVGRLGRRNVCAIVKDQIELPSDIHGIVWTKYDGAWPSKLAQELQASGYPIDWNKIMR